MSLEKFKLLGSSDVFTGPHTTYSAVSYAYGTGTTAGAAESLTWYYVERTGATLNTNDMKNLYHSFGIAREDDDTWQNAFNIFDQIRAGDMMIAVIPQSACGSYIQGSTLEINVPRGTGATHYTTFYGASIGGYIDPETRYEVSNDYDPDSKRNGGASVWLYRGTPYSGTVHGGRANPNSGLTTWTGANLSNDSTFPHLRATAMGRGDTGYDIPEGVALLEKGIICIFDNITANRYFVSQEVSGSVLFAGSGTTFYTKTFTGGTTWQPNTNILNRRLIGFTGSTANAIAKLTYRPVNVDYKTIYFCHAGQGEFNSTSNHTYNHRKAYYRPMEADSVYITEIGLYNDSDELIAYGKLSEPVEKNKLETLTLKVELIL